MIFSVVIEAAPKVIVDAGIIKFMNIVRKAFFRRKERKEREQREQKKI